MQDVEDQLDLDAELDLNTEKLAEFSIFWQMLIKEDSEESSNIAAMLNSEEKYGYFMLSLLAMWYEGYGWPSLDGQYITEKLTYSAEKFENEEIARQILIAAGNIPAKRLLAYCLCTIAKHQVPAAVQLMIQMLETIKEVDEMEYWIDLFKIAIMTSLDLNDCAMDEFVELSAHGGRSDLLILRLTPIQIMRMVLLHKPEYVMTGVEFTKNVLNSIIQLREGRLTDDDNTVIEEALFGLARSAPIEADALCSKYGPKLSSSTREKIKSWRQGKLHMCNSDLKRDYDNLFGVLEHGVLYLDQWKKPGECDDHDHDHHHDHGHHHH